MDIKNKILNIISPIIDQNNLLLIDLVVRGDERKRIIEVFVDSKENISADLLADINRKINSSLNYNEEEFGNYRLDVSSPGVDRPLKYLEQYYKHINRQFDLQFNDGNEIKKSKARLVSINNDNLLFDDGMREFLIKYNQIIKAKVLISFS